MAWDTALAPEGRPRSRASSLVRTASSSLTLRCVLLVGLYACVLAATIAATRLHAQSILSTAYAGISVLTRQEKALASDRFDLLLRALPPSCQFAIYDGSGACLTSSGPEIVDDVPFDELFCVPSDAEEDAYYEVLEAGPEDDLPPGAAFEIILCVFQEESATSRVLGRCVCDADLSILEGNLFEGRPALEAREFDLIRGEIGNDMQVERHDYTTEDGDERTLVFASPRLNERTYQRFVSQAEGVWTASVACMLLITLVAIAAVFRTLQRSMRPLEDAMRARRSGRDHMPEAQSLPIELRGTYRSFTELMDALEETREENQTLIADVSHDLKTPLTVIGGYAKAFADGCVPEDRRDAYLHAIYEKSLAASQLLDELLSIARLSHPAFVAHLECLDVCEQVRLAIISAYAEVEQAGDTVVAAVEEGPLRANLDAALFARIMSNLISNACCHNDPGTTILVSCTRDDGWARVSVADDGAGFSEEVRERAFEPLVTTNTARTTGKGTGLGLAIVRKGVLAQGGEVYLSDEAPAPYVTEIVVRLPLVG